MKISKLLHSLRTHSESHPLLYLILVGVLATILRLVALNQSFWLDEAAQAIISLQPFEKGHFNGDFQPPLSYYLTYMWMHLGQLVGQRSEWFLRIPMVAFSVGTVILLYQLLIKTFNRNVGLLGSLLLATAPFHIYYAHEHRMYAMLTFVTLLSWYFLWQKNWLGLAITTTIGIYTHYFAFLTVVTQIVYILLADRKNVQKSFTSIGLGLLPFTVWMPVLLMQIETSEQLIQAWPGWAAISNVGFIRFPSLVIAKFAVGMISPEPRWLYGAAVVVFFSGLLWSAGVVVRQLILKVKTQSSVFWICMAGVPLIGAWFGSLLVAASSPWRIQFVLPAIYGMVGYAVCTEWGSTNKLSRVAARFVCIYLLLQNLFFTSQYLLYDENHRENWKEAVAYTDTLAHDGAIVLTEYTAPWAPIQWYTSAPQNYIGSSNTLVISPTSVSEKLHGTIGAYQTIALYSYLIEISDPEKHVDGFLKENGYIIQSQKDFRGVGIVNIYARENSK